MAAEPSHTLLETTGKHNTHNKIETCGQSTQTIHGRIKVVPTIVTVKL